MFISIVIPTHNRARLLGDTLESLHALDFPAEQFEIIVVDDGSTDDTKSVTENCQTTGKATIRYFYQPPSRINAARNNGLRHAKGDFIIFTDDDVELPRNWLSVYAAALSAHPDVFAFGGPVRPRFEAGYNAPHVCGGCGTLEELETFNAGTEETDVRRVIGANMGMRREAFKKLGAFNTEFSGRGDETEWHLRLERSGGRLRYLPEAWLWHRRLPEDKWTIVKRMYKKRKGSVWFGVRTGEGLPCLSYETRRIFKYGWHAIRRRCFRGVLIAAWHVGVVAGWFQWVFLRQTQTNSDEHCAKGSNIRTSCP